MKPLLLSAFFLSVSTLACGKGSEPITAPPAARPTAVSIMSASVNDRSVTLTFTPTSSAAAASVQYHVTCQSGVGNYTATGKASPITIAGLTNGTQYSCFVTAVDANGTSDPSPAVMVTPAAAIYDASLFFLLTPGNGSATVAYDLPSGFMDRPWLVTVTCNSPGRPSVTTTKTDSVVGFVTVPGLQNGVTYSCAYSIASQSGVVISAQRELVPGTPVRPLEPGAASGNASVTLSFQPAADNGSPVTGYTATCVASGQESRTVNGASSPLVVAGLANGVAYSCDVYASNALGAGEHSASMSVIPGIPTAVKSITATTTSSSATFSFSPPDSDNGSPITSYTVACDPLGPSPAATASGAASPITVSGLRANWPYSCLLFATNANGNGVWAYISVNTTP